MQLRFPTPAPGIRLAAILAGTAFLLAACGGGNTARPGPGGGTGNEEPPPSQLAAPASLSIGYDARAFTFSWPAAPGATSYRLLEDADGQSGFAEIASGLTATSAHRDIGTLLHERLNARYAVQACNAQGCSANSPVARPEVNQAIGYFKASNAGAGDVFGTAVALSADGRTLAIGAPNERSDHQAIFHGPFEDNDLANFSGAVYVFTRSDAGWTQQAFLKAANADAGDQFGSAVALSADGNTLAVAASAEDSGQAGVFAVQPGDDETRPDAGAVYVFARSDGLWTQQAYVKASHPDALDRFGATLALSGDGHTLAVAATGDDADFAGVSNNAEVQNNDFENTGAVYVFARTGTDWTLQAFAKAFVPGTGDFYGASLALSHAGDRLAVGATGEDSDFTGVRTGPFADNALASESGAVYLYTRGDGGWATEAHVKGHAAASGQVFGMALAVSGDGRTLAVGAGNEASALRGIHAPGAALDTASPQSGAVYVFAHDGDQWSQQAFVKASNTQPVSQFGNRVAVSTDGGTLVVGAHWRRGAFAGIAAGDEASDPDDDGPPVGAAYVFRRDGTQWAQAAYLKVPRHEGRELQFGNAVAVSGDGRTAAIGAHYESGAATGVQGDQGQQTLHSSGAVFVF